MEFPAPGCLRWPEDTGCQGSLWLSGYRRSYRIFNSFIFPKEEKSPSSYAAQYTHSCAFIYYRGKSDNDRLIIWEKGQKIEPAPREIEQKAKEEYKNSQELNREPFAYPITLVP